MIHSIGNLRRLFAAKKLELIVLRGRSKIGAYAVNHNGVTYYFRRLIDAKNWLNSHDKSPTTELAAINYEIAHRVNNWLSKINAKYRTTPIEVAGILSLYRPISSESATRTKLERFVLATALEFNNSQGDL